MGDEEIRQRFRKALAFSEKHSTREWTIHGDSVIIGAPNALSSDEQAELEGHIVFLRPWRKGPFNLFGRRIDAHWKSDRKWDRLQLNEADVRGKVVCDVGANNGYYLYRLLSFQPERVVGVDPAPAFQRQFQFLHTLAPDSRLEWQTMGYADLPKHYQAGSFDLILCLGLIYHHTDVMHVFRTLHSMLKPQGVLIVETMGLPDDFDARPISLVPKGRYAGARGIWHVPGTACVLNWLTRAGFSQIDVIGQHRDYTEQVRTPDGDLPALLESIDAERHETSEGYPAPIRIVFRVQR